MNSWPQNLWVVIIGFLLSVVLGCWWMRRLLPGTRSFLSVTLGFLAGLIVTGATVIGWYYLRPQPKPVARELFRGVTYTRDVRQDPRPVVIHVVTVDLASPGISFLVTPADAPEKRPLAARTTSEFARQFGAQIALNGDFFSPWFSNTPWDYYPRSGERVGVHGIAASQGTTYTQGERQWDAPTLYLSRENRPSLTRPADGIYNAISGNIFLLRDGRRGPQPIPEKNTVEPRTAVGFDEEGRKLFLVAVDGRQPGYSSGLNYDELIQVLVDHGAHSAINLDGGGSTALVAEVRPGKWAPLNCPAHTRIPGRERPVGNHLGVMVKSGK